MARRRKNRKTKKLNQTHKCKSKNSKFPIKSSAINENNNVASENNSKIVQTKFREHNNIKQPIVAPNGKLFYPCQYCTKIFPRESTCKTHMDKCCNKNISQTNPNLNFIDNTENLNNEPNLLINTSSKNETNESIMAPNGKLFYPCKYCSKIFPRQTTFKTHMSKCFKKLNSHIKSEVEVSKKSLPNKEVVNISTDNTNLTKNIAEDKELKQGVNTESGSPKQTRNPKINIYQNIKIPPASTPVAQDSLEDDMEVTIVQKETPKYDLSIYDYDEDTTDEQPKNKDTQCKECPFVAENAIELIKHKRNEHSVPKKFLSPQEIQKYFDYPDRNFCPICERPIKSRNYRSVFIKHLLVHTTGLTFECRICKKKFRRNDHMRYHEKMHVISFAELQAIQDVMSEEEKNYKF